MPVYTYHCNQCSYEFEQKQHFSDDPLKICPRCGNATLRKVYLPVGIVFKGSGFYATDHKSPSGMTNTTEHHAGSGDNGSISTESSRVEPVSEVKPAEKKETPTTSESKN
ncbi:MAG TPA: zinc ribbon domain-containing protein [Bellilinea sp.]|nr:zinc ribbon domain-containing protein [Bellilinea sp.]